MSQLYALAEKRPILIVNDYETMICLIETLLHQIGFGNTERALGFDEAVGKIRSRPYRLVISDWTKGPATGFDLYQTLRSDAAGGTTPFLLITRKSILHKAAVSGAELERICLYKPFNLAALRSKITLLLNDALSG